VSTWNKKLARRLAGHDERVRRFESDLRSRMRRRQLGTKIQTAGFVCRKPDYDCLGRKAGEALPREGDSVLLVPHGGNGRAEIELAGVFQRICVVFEVEAQIAQRLIAGLRATAPLTADDLGRFRVFAASQQLDHPVEIGRDIER